jgi:phosphatidylglycerol lysyltransferase
VRSQGRLLAFASIFATETQEEAGIDLVRYVHDVPAYTLTFLYVHVMEQFKARNFRKFMLGLTPLPEFDTHPMAPLWHRFGDRLYKRGEPVQKLEDLRHFKQQFDPEWEPRYLTTAGGISPLLIITDIAALITGGAKAIGTR